VPQRNPGSARAALGSALIGAASGGAVLCLALLAYAPNRAAPAANFLPVLVAGLGGLAAGGLVAWALARQLGNPWRRAMTTMMGVMGSALVGGFTVPLHGAFGPLGLGGLFALCLAAIAAAWRFLLRGSSE
jgi:hypothetical protein